MQDRIAVMQPYFFPYGGYYRLMASADIFVIYDCVQFPRRGRVHRSEIQPHSAAGAAHWLTLPITKARQDTRICDIDFASDATIQMAQRLGRYGWFGSPATPLGQATHTLLTRLNGSVVDLLHHSLSLVHAACSFDCQIIRSSTLGIAAEHKGASRLIEITKELGGKSYINSPGGVNLYQAETFAEAGLELQFLDPYHGRIPNMLHAIFTQDVEDICHDILSTCTVDGHQVFRTSN